MQRIEVTVVPAEALAGAVAAWLAEQMVRAIALRGRCALALSGGGTPRPAYQALAEPRLDVLLLGMGGDGHTASLFPGSPALQESSRRVVPAESPLPPAGRLTITPPVIAAAEAVVVMVSGAGKAAMVARALEGPAVPLVIPIQLAAGARWFLDEAAASRLAVERRA
jgi:6-phosphogluconolactonase/glucosamine-6-phosphate isomerase/deaminase